MTFQNINQLKKEIEKVEKVKEIFAKQPNVRGGMTDNPNVEDVKKWSKWYKKYAPFRKHELDSDVLKAKLQTLEEVLKLIKGNEWLETDDRHTERFREGIKLAHIILKQSIEGKKGK